MKSWHEIYLSTVEHVLETGSQSAPRGKVILERLAVSLTIPDARRVLLVDNVRDLNYRFMLAEWLWIAGGFNELKYLLPFNKQYQNYSDDGVVLTGAYGPRLKPQWPFIAQTLMKDRDSRQAVATIWTPSPRPSKDIPCTVAAQFLVRGGALHSIWTMRSSDLWLGLPYDVFTFAMLQNGLAGLLNVEIGSLTMQLGSAHVYEEHWGIAQNMLKDRDHHLPTSNGAYKIPPLTNILSGPECRQALTPGCGYVIDDLNVVHRALHQPNKAKCLEVLLANQ